MSKKKKAYILPHTHWDREWRYPIWKSRMLLIRFMDELLEILDNDENYRCFLMDGQVAPVLDYLEVKPQNHKKISKYISDGRIAVGPWYTLPDLYPVDGECLIRNLLWGQKASNELGGCLTVGYNSFGWGQTAQLPQIYKGFGIDFIICAKRVSEERAPESEFLWQSPDGTSILTSRLGEHTRANFYFNTYLYAKYGANCFSSEFRYSPSTSGMAIHSAEPDRMDEDFFVISPNTGYDKERLIKSFDDSWKATDATVHKNDRLFLNGTDFSAPQKQLSAMIEDMNEGLTDIEVIHCTLEDYRDTLKTAIDVNSLRIIQGELRDGPSAECSGNALASRYYLKAANKEAQNTLIHRAEPLASSLWALGAEYPRGMINKAWEYLLKAHPHDSINGVTQDKTANDVEYRIAQATEIAQVVADEAIAEIAKRLDLSAYNSNSKLLLLHNPLPYAYRGIGKVCIATPASENIWDFTAKDTDGSQLRIQEISRDEKAYPVHDMQARPWPYNTHRHMCYIDFGEIPSMGYKVIEIVPKSFFGLEKFYWLPMRRTAPENLLVENHVLENQYLRAEIKTNGSIRLLHKESGKVYDDLHYFEDSGDVGNYWAYYPPYNNQIHTTLSGNARMWNEDNGPLCATVAVEYTMILPASAEESVYGVRGRGKRSNETVDLKITSRFTLNRYAKRLEVHTSLDNNAKNHRLRVAFTTGIKTEYADAEGHFTVDRRLKLNQQAEDGSYWPEMQTLPMQRFVDISDGKQGIALINSCLTEYELANDTKSTVYLTLFRAMGNMIVTWWEAVSRFENQDGSQVQRKMDFRYAICPHEGDWQQAEIYREAAVHSITPTSYQLCGGNNGDLPLSKSFLGISNQNIVLSSMKLSEKGDSIILRIFNPTMEKQCGEVTLGFNIKCAWKCSLNEERQIETPISDNNCFSLTAGKNEMLTFELEVQQTV